MAVAVGAAAVGLLSSCGGTSSTSDLVLVSRTAASWDKVCEDLDEVRTTANRFICRVEVGAITLHGLDGPTARIGRHEHVWKPAGFAEISFDCVGNVNRSGFTFNADGPIEQRALLEMNDDDHVRLDPTTYTETGDDHPCREERGEWIGLSGRLEGARGTYCYTWDRLQLLLVLSPDTEEPTC